MNAVSFALALAVSISLAPPPPQAAFAARIDRRPMPGPSTVLAIMFKAGTEVAPEVHDFLPPSTALYGSVVTTFGEYRPRVLMAEFPDGRHAIFSDFNADGSIQPSERLEFAARERGVQTAHFVVPGWRYASYPVEFSEPGDLPYRAAASPNLPPARGVRISSEVVLRGHVVVDGKDVLFNLGIDPKTGTPSATVARQFMDIDGNGVFDTDYRSPETVWARGAAAMFRVGGSYLSLASLDLDGGRAVFASRPAKDYTRFELTVGAVLPDFPFVDFEGRPHRLSDYRGKVVLLDFWGTWCGPCVAQIPFLKSAYDRFHARGFEIIGMNSEHPNATPADLTAGVMKARAFVAERGVAWPQAREASIKEVTARSFLVETWPTAVLIDRDGRIVSVDRTDLGQPSLRGDALSGTVGALIVK